MTDRHPFDDLPDDDPMLETDLAALGALLGDEAVWEEPTPGLEDAIVASIQREQAMAGDASDRSIPEIGSAPLHSAGPTLAEPAPGLLAEPTEPAEVIPFERPRRRWVGPLLGAAAALLAVAAFSLGVRLTEDDTERPPDFLIAMAATELAPGAEAVADVVATPLGTRIILDIRGLTPAPEGQYYEAWLRQSPEVGVSAGTFHLRGGDGTIELWAGVTMDAYPLITITLQEEGAGAASSGQVVLKGSIDG